MLFGPTPEWGDPFLKIWPEVNDLPSLDTFHAAQRPLAMSASASEERAPCTHQ